MTHEQLLKSTPWDWFQVAGRSQMWRGRIFTSGPNKERPIGVSKTLPGVYAEGETPCQREQVLHLKCCGFLPVPHSERLQPPHSSKGPWGWFVFSVISSSLRPCFEQVWWSMCYLPGRRTVFLCRPLTLRVHHPLQVTPRHMDRESHWESFPLKVQKPLLVKFCSHCPVSFP